MGFVGTSRHTSNKKVPNRHWGSNGLEIPDPGPPFLRVQSHGLLNGLPVRVLFLFPTWFLYTSKIFDGACDSLVTLSGLSPTDSIWVTHACDTWEPVEVLFAQVIVTSRCSSWNSIQKPVAAVPGSLWSHRSDKLA